MMKLIQNFGKKNEIEMELTSDAKQILFFLKKDVTSQTTIKTSNHFIARIDGKHDTNYILEIKNRFKHEQLF
jgi:hypothetical protein